MDSYISHVLPSKTVTKGHQKECAWTDQSRSKIETQGKTYSIKQKGRRQYLEESRTKSNMIVPCDVYNYGNGMELIASKHIQYKIDACENKVTYFIEELIREEPSMEQICKALPHHQEDHKAIADLLANGNLVAGRDGGDNQDVRIVFSITIASEDLFNVHTLSHEVQGGPKDSGRAEIIGIMVVIVDLCHVIKWNELPEETQATVYCDNREAIEFSKHKWIGKTQKWSDARNIELTRTIYKDLRIYGRGLKIEHVRGHQDQNVTFEDLPLPAKINVFCNKGCQERLLNKKVVEKGEQPREPMSEAIACLKVDGVPIMREYKRVLGMKTYAEVVAKHLGLQI